MSDTDDKEKMDYYMRQWPEFISKEMTVVPMNGKLVFHFGKDPKIKKFIPNVTHRTMTKENRSVARISTGETLFGCLRGHGEWIYDFIDIRPGRQGYMGGWYIYAFDVPYAILPSHRLLPDIKDTGERWIVPYKPELWSIPAWKIGKFFVHQLTFNGHWDSHQPITFVIEISADITMPFTKDISLTKGYWRIDINEKIKIHKAKGTTVTQLDVKEYLRLKGISAEMLSIVDGDVTTIGDKDWYNW